MPIQTLTLQERAGLIADEYHVPRETLSNLIESESHWDPSKISETDDRGIVQINAHYHPEVSDECAFNPDCAIAWAAKRIQQGYLYEWTVANCYSYVSLFVHLPPMPSITPNSAPSVGSVAIFDYKGLKHVAYVVALKEEGFLVKEANFEPAKVAERLVNWNDKALEGFWNPPFLE